MNKSSIDIIASEIADSEYCEISWSFSNTHQTNIPAAKFKKGLIKGDIAHQEHIRAEEALGQLSSQRNFVKAIIILFILGSLLYLLYFLWK